MGYAGALTVAVCTSACQDANFEFAGVEVCYLFIIIVDRALLTLYSIRESAVGAQPIPSSTELTEYRLWKWII